MLCQVETILIHIFAHLLVVAQYFRTFSSGYMAYTRVSRRSLVDTFSFVKFFSCSSVVNLQQVHHLADITCFVNICTPLCEIKGNTCKLCAFCMHPCLHIIECSSISPLGVSQTVPFSQMKSLLVAPLPADFLQVLHDVKVVLSIFCLL